jgi:hypothetical protein
MSISSCRINELLLLLNEHIFILMMAFSASESAFHCVKEKADRPDYHGKRSCFPLKFYPFPAVPGHFSLIFTFI